MGNICGCLKSNGTVESAYVEIATVDSTVTRIKPVEKPSNANYYQAILEQATSNFISSKDLSKNDTNINSSEEADTLRSKFAGVTVSPSATLSPNKSLKNNGALSADTFNIVRKSEQKLERAADDIGTIISNRSSVATVDKNYSAVVNFKAADGLQSLS